MFFKDMKTHEKERRINAQPQRYIAYEKCIQYIKQRPMNTSLCSSTIE